MVIQYCRQEAGCGGPLTRTASSSVRVQSPRNAKAAKQLMRKLVKEQGHAPRVLITDKLGSYTIAGRN
jgi:transposase-like protein